MKIQNLLINLFLIGLLQPAIGQDKKQQVDSTFSFSVVAKSMKVIQPFFDEPVSSINEDGKTYVVKNKMRRQKFTNSKNALPKGGDPLWLQQQQKSSRPNKAPIVNWDGLSNSQSGGAIPPDPSGAAGPNHYVQMVNSVYRVFDKSGNALTAPAALGTLLGGGNAGDPIVMYDKFADRWFLSQFKGYPMGEIYVAISQTSDPTGAYYLYEFDLGSFPDYPKYSVWTDGYYFTANKSGDNAYVMERDKMIAGDPSAQIIGFTIPNLTTDGFFSVLPSTASSTLPPLGTPNNLFYFEDDGWAGGTDQLKIWEVNVDWNTPSSSFISAPQLLPVTPFDSEFEANWNDITQPGTSAKIDAVPGALMYMGHYRSFNTHNSIVLNHTVDVNGANLAGIRWYELRQTGSGPWSIFQEGTFNPDTENRWMGSIAMDYQGNIGLAYSVSGSTTYPSLRYTGRYANDPLGQMTLNEEVIVNGTSSQTSSERYGDYAQMTIDPIDDATFWFTGEYVSSEWKTRIVSFKIADDSDDDLGISTITNPTNGTLTSTESITVNISNYGLNSQANFPVSYQVNGGGVITETYVGTLSSGNNVSYTFSALADLSTIGNYSIKAFTGLSNDQFNNNDTTFYTVKHLGPNDVGVTTITSPSSAYNLGISETVSVTLKNFGAVTQTNIPVHYTINNGTPVSETFTGSLTPNTTASFSFNTTADLSSLGNYNLKAYTVLPSDSDLNNDSAYTDVEHSMCLPQANCLFGDGLIKVELENLLNNSTCSGNGYGDFTSLAPAVVERGATVQLKLQSGYVKQHGTVWIDFNDNFVFDPSEKLISNHEFGTSISNVNLAIPANANLGEHLMRIRTRWDNDIDDPCIDTDYGETEDYKVTISPFSSIAEEYKSVTLNLLTKENNQFEVVIKNMNEDATLEVTNSIGQRIISDQFFTQNNYKLDLNSVAPGYYLIRVSNQNISKIGKVWVR